MAEAQRLLPSVERQLPHTGTTGVSCEFHTAAGKGEFVAATSGPDATVAKQEAHDPSTVKVQGLQDGTLQDLSGNGTFWEVDWVQQGQEFGLMVVTKRQYGSKIDTDAMIAEARALSNRLP